MVSYTLTQVVVKEVVVMLVPSSNYNISCISVVLYIVVHTYQEQECRLFWIFLQLQFSNIDDAQSQCHIDNVVCCNAV